MYFLLLTRAIHEVLIKSDFMILIQNRHTYLFIDKVSFLLNLKTFVPTANVRFPKS